MSTQSGARVASYFAVFAAGSVAAAAFFSVTQSSSANLAEAPVSNSQEQVADQKIDLPAATTSEAEVVESSPSTEPTVETQTLASPAPNPVAPISSNQATAVTQIADVRRGTMVSVQGVVERVTDEDEFVIADSSGSIPVWTGQSFFVVQPGETVTVNGFVDDDLFLEIYAQEIVLADGTSVKVTGESW